MAKLRVFVSSTFYDLKYVRSSLEPFLKSFDYQGVHFERNDITFSNDRPLDVSCFKEMETCDMQILIIGGSYGSAVSEINLTEEQIKDPYFAYKSITKGEFEAALGHEIPVYIFVEENVYAEYHTFKKNRDNKSINYAHGNPNTFYFLDYIHNLPKNNWIQKFATAEDIMSGLRAQWSNLFRELLSARSTQAKLETLNTNLSILGKVTANLREYSEAILKHLDEPKFQELQKSDEVLDHEITRLKAMESELLQYLDRNTFITKNGLVDMIVDTKSYGELYDRMIKEGDLILANFDANKNKQAFRLYKDLKFSNGDPKTYKLQMVVDNPKKILDASGDTAIDSASAQMITKEAAADENVMYLKGVVGSGRMEFYLLSFSDSAVNLFKKKIIKKYGVKFS